MRSSSGTTSSAAPTPPTWRSGSELADDGRTGRSSTSAAGPGGSPCTWPGAGTGSSGSTRTRRWSRRFDRAGGSGLPAEAERRRRARVRPRGASSGWCWRRCSSCSSSAARASGVALPAAASPRTCARVGSRRGRDRRGDARARRRTAPRPSPTSARSTAGSTPACRSTPASTPGAIVVRRLRQTVSPDGELSDEVDEIGLRLLAADDARGRGARGRAAARGPPRDPRRPTTTSARPSSSWRRPDGAARPRPLPRADEHLRRPRQHPLPAAALRVARDRLRLRRRRPGRARRPGRPRPPLHRRRPGPRPARWSPPTWSRRKREALAAAVDDGAVLLAVCGGYQLLGHSYQLGEERLPGLGLADLETVREPGAAADRQRRDRGRPRRRPAD